MDYLFSIHPQHAAKLFSGEKKVELRRGRVQLSVPSRIWIYVTTPSKQLAGIAHVQAVEHGSPRTIWARHSKKLCISRDDFNDYVGSRSTVSAIIVKHVTQFDTPVDLDRLREILPTFHPPQFYLNIHSKKGYTNILNREIGAAAFSFS